jgi:hypothetical protein
MASWDKYMIGLHFGGFVRMGEGRELSQRGLQKKGKGDASKLPPKIEAIKSKHRRQARRFKNFIVNLVKWELCKASICSHQQSRGR